MNLQQLEYILAVNTHRHFATAAEKCFVTQPTLSMMIQKLEDELGVKIFDRSKQPVVPTEVGSQLIEQAGSILHEVKKLREIADLEQTEIKGELRLAIIPTLAPYLMPLFIRSFSEKYPSVKLHIAELTTEQIVRKLKQDQLDVAIMATPTSESSLLEDPLFFEEFVVYAAQEESILSKKFVLSADIDVNRLVLLEEGHCLRSQILNLCALKESAGFVNNIFYEAGSIETLKRMVEANSGITILPELALKNLDEDQMRFVRFFKAPAPVREVSLVTRRAFVKKRLIEVLKVEILNNLPSDLRRTIDNKVMSIS
jgi:LysR family transcriptional regulator, hydrogen peroxide-inducible genes activator